MTIRFFSWFLWCLTLLIWTILLVRPEPVTIQEVAVPMAWRYFLAKGMHVGVYALLSGWGWLLLQQKWRMLGVGLLCHGAFTEYLQTFTLLRHGDIVDVAWDALGVGLGLILARVIYGLFSSSDIVSK